MIDGDILAKLPSPAWLLEESLLDKNIDILESLQQKSGAKILLALKGYALWRSFATIRDRLQGCCASGLLEAKLASEEFGGEVHTYSPAFKDSEIDEIATISHHIVFNSPSQFQKYAKRVKDINPKLSLGLRINPESSHSPVEMYNPCGLYSRLGTTIDNFDRSILDSCDGFHFHALCEESADALEGVLDIFEEKFGEYLYALKWINFGGGHHITKEGYDIEKLISLIERFRERYQVEIYLEPGEAVGWKTGTLIATVLDIVHNGIDIAILDISAEAHMPDTIIMPYRAEVRGASEMGLKRYGYRLSGNSCLAGDVMGDYSFDEPLKVGDRVIFEDQMHYTMVKATTFNGIKLPSICILKRDNSIEVVREFGYEEFRDRLS
ncbi:Carboxynorspermidine decarboxylase, putative [hydrothermal vent metagenome]|uniref:Carboxynorspermidine decarboxylase, putative n=1 Tax=hydrothermal vent metagenome TaxID=652676 RepID=A0A1W1CBZ8_9ZZZZ